MRAAPRFFAQIASVCFLAVLPAPAQIASLNNATFVASDAPEQEVTEVTAIVGGTLVDVTNFGDSTEDISQSVVLIRDGRIIAVGDLKDIRVPADAHVVDASGDYLIPGLIDGFGALRTQGFADAYLSEGVTSVYVQLSPAGEDGEVKLGSVKNGPDILRGAMIGGYTSDGTPSHEHPWTSRRLHDKRLTPGELIERVDDIAATGNRGVLIGLDVWPDQLDVIVREAHAKGLVTYGEMAFTSYPYALRGGIDTIIRSDRYQTAIDLAQDLLAYSDDPEGPGGAPGYRGVCDTEISSASVAAFGDQLRTSHAALMPLLSIEATADDLNTSNPWDSPVSRFVAKGDLDDPVDPSTGARPYLESHTKERQAALKKCAFHREALDGRFHQLGAHFLAGSASPAFGIMPGSGMHGELSLLQRIGLTPRQAVAAATDNYSEVFGWRDRGLIAIGRRADILLLTADPRSDVAALNHIKSVIFGGKTIRISTERRNSR
jgi:hypothetical protein